MQADNFFLKKWEIYNDSDKKSKFLVRLFYDNKIHITSYYKVKSSPKSSNLSYKAFCSKEFEEVGNYVDPEKIGVICLELYELTIKRLENLDTFIDMMENFNKIEFQIVDKKK
jgi:hypothetical protein